MVATSELAVSSRESFRHAGKSDTPNSVVGGLSAFGYR